MIGFLERLAKVQPEEERRRSWRGGEEMKAEHSSELERIVAAYGRRETIEKSWGSLCFEHFVRCERELLFLRALRISGLSPWSASLIELGAGRGDNLLYFHRIGFDWSRLCANELLPERAAELRRRCSGVKVVEGDACAISESDSYDVVFQSLVFSSILDGGMRVELAQKMSRLLSPEGVILWYDFTTNNPWNRDVRGVPLKEIRQLFRGYDCKFWRCTVLPPWDADFMGGIRSSK
jgi:phospholipid N-methyltransferase